MIMLLLNYNTKTHADSCFTRPITTRQGYELWVFKLDGRLACYP